MALLPVAAAAQDNAGARKESLADIRQSLQVLYFEIQQLRTELSTTHGATGTPGGAGPALVRVDALEQELRRLTGDVEQLQFRIEQIVQDGTNRIADLEFRLVELEGGDLSKLGKTTTLGGGELPAAVVPPVATDTPENAGSAELAVAEQEDFDAAKRALDEGNFVESSDRFLAFIDTYPGGPLTGEAYFWRGEALAALSDWKNAARSYLESFSGSPLNSKAPDAFFKLGVSLGKLSQIEAACETLGELSRRYPAAAVVPQAAAEMQTLGCS
ncbi:MAG TPA: tol-pal system protein YbgF [Afifellaceae bacterium]|nr:tol-pal system protein YbgF [Afifellaceae bacterium]